MTKSEKKILAKIRQAISYSFGKKYMFWFVYDDDDKAIDWEGGYGLSLTQQFRNQYTLEQGKNGVVKNF